MLTACETFGLMVSEAKTEIMCLRRRSCAGERKLGERVDHRHCSRPGVQTNGRVCVLGRGYQREPESPCRVNASTPEGMGVLPAVKYGNQ